MTRSATELLLEDVTRYLEECSPGNGEKLTVLTPVGYRALWHAVLYLQRAVASREAEKDAAQAQAIEIQRSRIERALPLLQGCVEMLAQGPLRDTISQAIAILEGKSHE
jgi:hypothetical protein